MVKATRLQEFTLLSELSLNGGLKPVRGALSMAVAARRAGLKGIVLPAENAPEAAVVERLEIIGATSVA